MKGKENESDSIKPTYKGGSPLALEAKTAYLQNKDMLKKIPVNRKQLSDKTSSRSAGCQTGRRRNGAADPEHFLQVPVLLL